MKGKQRINKSAKARSPTRRIGSIPEFQEKLDTVVDIIDSISDNDPDVSKAISSCSVVTIYSRDTEARTSFQVFGSMVMDLAMNMGDLAESYDDGTWTESEDPCPHARECGSSDCSLCVFAPLRTIDLTRMRGAVQRTPTAGDAIDTTKTEQH